PLWFRRAWRVASPGLWWSRTSRIAGGSHSDRYRVAQCGSTPSTHRRNQRDFVAVTEPQITVGVFTIDGKRHRGAHRLEGSEFSAHSVPQIADRRAVGDLAHDFRGLRLLAQGGEEKHANLHRR